MGQGRRPRRSRKVPGTGPATIRMPKYGYSHLFLTGCPFLSMISTLRFFCLPSGSSLPSGVVLGATGFLAPNPRVANLEVNSRLWRDTFQIPAAETFFFGITEDKILLGDYILDKPISICQDDCNRRRWPWPKSCLTSNGKQSSAIQKRRGGTSRRCDGPMGSRYALIVGALMTCTD